MKKGDLSYAIISYLFNICWIAFGIALIGYFFEPDGTHYCSKIMRISFSFGLYLIITGVACMESEKKNAKIPEANEEEKDTKTP